MKKLSVLLVLLTLAGLSYGLGLPRYTIGDVGSNEALSANIIGNRVAVTGTGSKIAVFRSGKQGATPEVASIDKDGNLVLSGGITSTGSLSFGNLTITGAATIENLHVNNAWITTEAVGTSTITDAYITTGYLTTIQNSGTTYTDAIGPYTFAGATSVNGVNLQNGAISATADCTFEGTTYFGTTGKCSIDASGNLKTQGAITAEGSIKATGNITGNTFNGSGTGLTGVGLLASNNTFTGVNTFEGKAFFTGGVSLGACTYVFADTSNTASNGTYPYVVWTNEKEDARNEFNPANGIITVEADGFYLMNFQLYAGSTAWTAGDEVAGLISRNGSLAAPNCYYHSLRAQTNFTGYMIINGSRTLWCNAGDSIGLMFYSSRSTSLLNNGLQWMTCIKLK